MPLGSTQPLTEICTRNISWGCRGGLKTNEELENAIRYENIVRHIKSKRLSWLAHVERMTNERVPEIIYKWKPYATRPKGRPRLRWEDDVRNDLGSMGVKN